MASFVYLQIMIHEKENSRSDFNPNLDGSFLGILSVLLGYNKQYVDSKAGGLNPGNIQNTTVSFLYADAVYTVFSGLTSDFVFFTIFSEREYGYPSQSFFLKRDQTILTSELNYKFYLTITYKSGNIQLKSDKAVGSSYIFTVEVQQL